MNRPRPACPVPVRVLRLLVFAALSGPCVVFARPVGAQPPPDLVLDGGRAELGGRHVYGRVVLRNRARLEIQPYSGTTDTGQLELVADSIEIDRSSTIVG